MSNSAEKINSESSWSKKKIYHTFPFFVDVILGIVNHACVLYNYIVHGFTQLCCIFHYFFLLYLLKLHFTCLIMQFKLYQI